MSAILAFLSAKGSALAMGMAIPLGLGIAIKLIPKKLANSLMGLINKQMDKVADIEDPIRKGLYMSLALDIVRIAEYEIPDKGKGEERYRMAAEKLCAVLPFLKGQDNKIEELIEDSVAAMDAELQKLTPPK